MNILNVLICCEVSGVIRREFRRAGHNAWSNDLLPAADGSPHHLQMDALEAIKQGPPGGGQWSLVVAHPVCTRLALSGSLRLYYDGKKANGPDPVKWAELDRAAAFFRSFFDVYDGPLCVENPLMHGHALNRIGKPHGVNKQIVQPFELGDDASKATVLWCRGLPLLKRDPNDYVPPRLVCRCGTTWRLTENDWCPGCGESSAFSAKRWANQTDSGQNRLPPSGGRAAARAVTYDGLAKAMCSQWGNFLATVANQPACQ